jgi:hypothetical protein
VFNNFFESSFFNSFLNFLGMINLDIPVNFMIEHSEIFRLFIPLILWTIAFLKFKKTQI